MPEIDATKPTPENPKPGAAPEKKAKRRMNAASLKNLKKGPPARAPKDRAKAPADAAAPVTSTPKREPAPARAGWSLFDLFG